MKRFSPPLPALRMRRAARSLLFAARREPEYNYCEAFSFLNESRKKQMAELLSESGNLPIYYPGDAEVLLRAAYTANEGELFLRGI